MSWGCNAGAHHWVPMYRWRWHRWWLRKEYYWACGDCGTMRRRRGAQDKSPPV